MRGQFGPNCPQPLMDLAQSLRRCGFCLTEQYQPFGVGLQHHIGQAVVPFRSLLPHLRDPGPRRTPDLAPIQRYFARYGAEQGGFSRSVAPNQTDPLARMDGQIGAIQQHAATQPDGRPRDHEEGHRADLPVARKGGNAYRPPLIL